MGALDGGRTIDASMAERVIDDLSGAPTQRDAEGVSGHRLIPDIAVGDPVVPVVTPARDTQLDDRVALLEQQIEAQEAALRRVLTLMIDWVEREGAPSELARALPA